MRSTASVCAQMALLEMSKNLIFFLVLLLSIFTLFVQFLSITSSTLSLSFPASVSFSLHFSLKRGPCSPTCGVSFKFRRASHLRFLRFVFISCSQKCQSGKFGTNCSRACSCQNGALCSFMDGSCTCTAGWQGRNCSEVCSKGKYGDQCSKTCVCQNGAQCDPVNGKCTCTAGWTDTACDKPCPVSN